MDARNEEMVPYFFVSALFVARALQKLYENKNDQLFSVTIKMWTFTLSYLYSRADFSLSIKVIGKWLEGEWKVIGRWAVYAR